MSLDELAAALLLREGVRSVEHDGIRLHVGIESDEAADLLIIALTELSRFDTVWNPDRRMLVIVQRLQQG
jgi:hypothetical protein